MATIKFDIPDGKVAGLAAAILEVIDSDREQGESDLELIQRFIRVVVIREDQRHRRRLLLKEIKVTPDQNLITVSLSP